MSNGSVAARTVGLLAAIAVVLTVLWVLFAILDWLSGPLSGLLLAVLVVAIALYVVGSRL